MLRSLSAGLCAVIILFRNGVCLKPQPICPASVQTFNHVWYTQEEWRQMLMSTVAAPLMSFWGLLPFLLIHIFTFVLSYDCHYNVSLPPGCEENEWSCGNGVCLPQDVRCDNKKDCEDGSDEASCINCKRPITHVQGESDRKLWGLWKSNFNFF